MFSKLFKTNSENETEEVDLDENRIPNHIAIIMDGNGRWAQKRHLPRVAGHKQGMENVKEITRAASNLGVKVLTLYAFSTENWKRPESEVSFLMDLPSKFFGRAEIVTGVRKIAEKVRNNELAADEIDEETIRRSLMTASVFPYDDPELLIRTSGEERISNFLLWQLAYSEMVFTDVFWPDYSPANLAEDIRKFQQRDRRFGGLNEEEIK